MMFIFTIIGIFAVAFFVGYSYATKSSLLAIENVERWIEHTESNCWVQYEMYRDLEDKYEQLLSEYHQYRGTMKAINDYCKKGDKNG